MFASINSHQKAIASHSCQRVLQHVFFLGIWVAKLGANPWFRKKLHLQHHTVSGQDDDAEERLIGLGLPMGMKRMAVTVHPMGPRKYSLQPLFCGAWALHLDIFFCCYGASLLIFFLLFPRRRTAVVPSQCW